MKRNFDVYKTNLKKSLRIISENIFEKKTQEVIEDYEKPAQIGFIKNQNLDYSKTSMTNSKNQTKNFCKSKYHNDQYFFDSEQKNKYGHSEKKRLKSLVDNLKKEFYGQKRSSFDTNYLRSSNKSMTKDIRKYSPKKTEIKIDP